MPLLVNVPPLLTSPASPTVAPPPALPPRPAPLAPATTMGRMEDGLGRFGGHQIFERKGGISNALPFFPFLPFLPRLLLRPTLPTLWLRPSLLLRPPLRPPAPAPAPLLPTLMLRPTLLLRLRLWLRVVVRPRLRPIAELAVLPSAEVALATLAAVPGRLGLSTLATLAAVPGRLTLLPTLLPT